jgi:hypothetical protein
MLIHLSDPALIESLVEFLERCGCRSREAGRAVVQAMPSIEPVDAHLAKLQLDGYLRTWRSMHHDVEVTLGPGSGR